LKKRVSIIRTEFWGWKLDEVMEGETDSWRTHEGGSRERKWDDLPAISWE
jgi:hypothetical protein